MSQSPADPDPASLRASDKDRESAAEVLREAAGEGRLSMTELDERLDAVYEAKTYAELEPIIRDLPHRVIAPDAAAVQASPPASAVERSGAKPASGSAIAVMSGFSRKGDWVVPANFTAVVVMGGGELDLRDAKFSAPVVNIHATAIMGAIAIYVPDDAEVQVTGVGLLGVFEHGPTGAGRPGGPKIHIGGVAFWGAVDVRRKPYESKGARKRRELQAERQELEQATRQNRKPATPLSARAGSRPGRAAAGAGPARPGGRPRPSPSAASHPAGPSRGPRRPGRTGCWRSRPSRAPRPPAR